MKILLVMDQFDHTNNGTTMSAVRFAETLKRHGHEVRIVSTGKETPDKYVVRSYHFQTDYSESGHDISKAWQGSFEKSNQMGGHCPFFNAVSTFYRRC